MSDWLFEILLLLWAGISLDLEDEHPVILPLFRSHFLKI